MWGAIFALVGLVCVVGVLVILMRMMRMLRRHGMHLLSAEPLRSVPRPDRRPLMRAIRRGEPVPPEYLDAARYWARRQRLTRGPLWIPILMMPIFANGLRADIIDPGPLGQIGFWLILAGMCLMVGANVPLWRDQRAAARLLRDSAPPA